MSGSQIHQRGFTVSFIPERVRTSYLVARRQDGWFIMFGGDEFGPYKSEREAKLFAIDAAHKLGELGEDTEVLLADEAGDAHAVWRHGEHRYPPTE